MIEEKILKNKYYIKISKTLIKDFEAFLNENNFDYLSLSFADSIIDRGTCLYSAKLTGEEVVIIKLRFPIIGFLDFAKTIGRQIKQV
jgi:hypothetical protein